MHRLAFVVPGDIETRTGGYIYDRRIAAGLRARGWRVDVCQPDLAPLADGSLVLVDGLALLSLHDAVGRHARRLRLVPLIHLPLALEIGLDAAEAARRHAIEERAIASARLVVATGRVTASQLAARGVRSDRIALVEPGTDAAPIARGSGGGRVELACVGALTAGKGHERLLRALAAVPPRNWALTCAGAADRDPTTAARLRALVDELGLAAHVTFAGELDAAALVALYDRSDVFALVTLRETYGMAVAEAIARGIPVVSTTVGAIRETVGGGGVLVAPDDHPALVDALTRIIGDGTFRRVLAERARESRARLRTWDEASRAMEKALTQVGTE